MESFREYIEDQDFVMFVENVFNERHIGLDLNPIKPWKASKDEVLKTWRNLRNDLPIYITPMKDGSQPGKKTSYGEDGIRITGSWQFIAAILGRIKDVLNFENPETRLRVIFRGIDSNQATPDRRTFAFYLNLQKRGSGKHSVPTIV